MHNRQMFLVPQRLECRHCGMQSKEPIKVNGAFLAVARAWNGDAGTHGVISLLTMRNHNIQPVSRAALEEYDEPFLAGSGRFRSAIEIASGAGSVDESMLTGEPMPAGKQPGDKVFSDLFTLKERARLQGFFSGVWGTSALAGPARH